jgi:hypothetical protein
MKKTLVILVMGLIFASFASAQTYNDVKSVNSKELKALNSQLERINDRIYYLDVTLPIDSAATNGAMHKSTDKKRDLTFRLEESKRLKAQKTLLIAAIGKIDSSFYKIEDQRMTEGSPNNLPEQMSPREYKRRSRTQAFETLENTVAIMDANQKLKGKLINNKVGTKENAYFYFKRLDINEAITRPGIIVKPNSEESVWLPMGEYLCTVQCGSFSTSGIVHVDPRVTTEAGQHKETVHFWAAKELSDY